MALLQLIPCSFRCSANIIPSKGSACCREHSNSYGDHSILHSISRGYSLPCSTPGTPLSHQVVEEVRKFFNEKVYQTLIPRNVTLSEAPSHGRPAILYDARSKGAQSYLSLAKEMLDENGFRQGA